MGSAKGSGESSVGGDLGLERLRRRREFVAVSKGSRHGSDLFTLQAIATDTSLRVGLTVTKKTGGATERNRIRRRLRAALRARCDELRDWPADLVVVARRPVLSVPFHRLQLELAASAAALRRKLDGRRGRPASIPAPLSEIRQP